MIELRARTNEPPSIVRGATLKLTLIFQDRQRSRLRVVLSDGQEAALLLPRGTVLRGGDTLALTDGRVALIEAAAEQVSTVRSHAQEPRASTPRPDSAEELSRAAYHLGNRHVPLQVGSGFLRYLRDHVLDAMVLELGLAVVHEDAPFEPESGAYGKHTHPPGHHHGHSHGVTRALGLVGASEASGESVDLADGPHVR